MFLMIKLMRSLPQAYHEWSDFTKHEGEEVYAMCAKWLPFVIARSPPTGGRRSNLAVRGRENDEIATSFSIALRRQRLRRATENSSR